MKKSPSASQAGFVSTLFLVLGCLALPSLIALAFLIWHGTPGEEKNLLIPKGASITEVSQILFEEGVVARPQLLKYVLKFTRGSSKLRAGEFHFQIGMSVVDALNTLYYADPILHRVTVPEGWNIRQIAQALSEAGLGNSARFIKLALSSKIAAKYKIKSPTLEGYLYPDTYSFSKSDTEEIMLDRMVQRFWQEWNLRFASRMKNQPFTLEQIVTLASIVEKETGVSNERKLIASVFYNRLKKRMRLQSDPTTIYGIANFNGNLTRADLLRPNEYNTYTIYGLPPGPIASPGMAAIEAVFDPASTEYLYFVSNNQGGHVFSKTYQEHARYVTNYHPKLPPRKKASP